MAVVGRIGASDEGAGDVTATVERTGDFVTATPTPEGTFVPAVNAMLGDAIEVSASEDGGAPDGR